MSRGLFRFRSACLGGLLALLLSACSVAHKDFSASTATAAPVLTMTTPALPVTSTQQFAVSSRTAVAPSTTQAEPVTVVAVKGSLFIRRGPDQAFNPVSVLREGQSAPALARDVLAGWVQIPIPSQPEKNGWISIQTQFTAVRGDVLSLPEVEPTDWPELASLRNCTHHQMWIAPANMILPSVDNFPANDVRLDPGTYVIYDTDVDGYPEVLTVDVREGSAIDVRIDGNGEKKKCPLP